MRNLLALILIAFTFNVYAQSQLETVIVGNSVTLTVTGYNGTIQWQQSNDSLTWSDISGATTSPYQFIATTSPTNKRFYRAKITDALCPNATPFYSSIIRHKINANTNQVIIGDWFHGGIVFYTDGSGNGLIAPQQDQSTGVQWGCSGTSISGATSLTDGAANTVAIVTACSTRPIAASICDSLNLNGYSDWYLPAKDQLNYLYQQRALVGGFSTLLYWSSSESSASTAWLHNFDPFYGTPGSLVKSVNKVVRCVRSFSPTDNFVYSNAIVTNQPVTVNFSSHPSSQNKCFGTSVRPAAQFNQSWPV